MSMLIWNDRNIATFWSPDRKQICQIQENSMSNLNKTTLSDSHWKDSASSLRGIVWRDRKETRNIARIRHDKANGIMGKTAVNGLDANAFEAIFIT